MPDPQTTITLVEGVLALLKGAGLTAYIIDGSKAGDCCIIVPYSSTHESGTAPIGTQLMQIRVASADYKRSETNAWTAYRAVAGKRPANTDRDVVGLIRPLQEPFFLSKSEDNTRYIQVFNIAISAVDKPAPTTNTQ